jgi:uncharacterized Fe-S cluster-containing radical SAM superfamily protein
VGDLSSGNLTITLAQNLFNKLKDMINSSVVKARLYDANNNLVKEFTDLQNIMVGVGEDYVYLYVRIVDMSNDTYKFKTMHLIATDGSTQFVAVIHPFLKEYEKTENQIVDIKVKTGILGCVST